MAAPNLTTIKTQQERAIYKAFMSSIKSIKDQAIIAEIAALINVGDIEGVLDLLQLSPAAYVQLEESIRGAYYIGGTVGASQLGRIPTPKGSLVLRFNTRSPSAERWLANLSSSRIVEITDDTRQVVRTVLVDGMSKGKNPRSMALDLVGRVDTRTKARTGGYIGLTEQQSTWVSTARDELETLDPNYLTRKLRDRRFDKLFEKAIASGRPPNQRQINSAVSNMQARALRYRAENIGRTEALSALSEGQNQAIAQAMEAAEIDKRDTLKFWDASGDSRTRPDHSAAEERYRGGIPYDQYFEVGGELMMWPRDPSGSASNTINCRCKLITKVDFAGQFAREVRGFG